MEKTQTIEEAIIHPIYEMVMEALTTNESFTRNHMSRQVAGVRTLSEELSVSMSLIYQMKKTGVLDEAVVSRIGKRIVFDVDKAWALAKNYQDRQRLERKERRCNNE